MAVCVAVGALAPVAGFGAVTSGRALLAVDARSIVGVAQREFNDPTRNHEIAVNCSFYGGEMFGWPRRGCEAAPPGWGGGTPDYKWCAGFAKYVWREAGVTEYLSELTAWAQSFKDYGERHHTWHARDSGYEPQAGDAVVFDYNPHSVNPIDHVGIVIFALGDTLYSIDGNIAVGHPTHDGVGVAVHPAFRDDTTLIGFTTAVGVVHSTRA